MGQHVDEHVDEHAAFLGPVSVDCTPRLLVFTSTFHAQFTIVLLHHVCTVLHHIACLEVSCAKEYLLLSEMLQEAHLSASHAPP